MELTTVLHKLERIVAETRALETDNEKLEAAIVSLTAEKNRLTEELNRLERKALHGCIGAACEECDP